MERILIRAGVAPWAEYNALDVITDKIIGNNTGNLLFANSITRLVATADSLVDFISDLTLVKKHVFHHLPISVTVNGKTESARLQY